MVDSSPRPIAASHVLHRLLVPRHPPFALGNLTTKMLASTVQFSNNNQPPHHPSTRPTPTRARYRAKHGIDPKTQTTPTRGACLFLQDPTGCPPPETSRTPPSFPPTKGLYSTSRGRCRLQLASVSAIEHPPPTFVAGGLLPHFRGEVLLRKEVIQPHLPVRLPCYDFVPIASPTFDSSLPQGVGPPASGVTDFRDVTGGVYKARERIHRSNADLRLLATPTSRGRVADPDPN